METLEWFSPHESAGERKRKGERHGGLGGYGGGIKASSGNPDWLKGAMRDYERIYLRFSAATSAAVTVAAMLQQLGSVWYTNNKK